MKNRSFFFLLIILTVFVSCDRVDDDVESRVNDIPSCILEMIEDEDLPFPISVVSIQKINREYHYLVDYWADDVNRNIFNTACELECYYSDWVLDPSGCIDNYNIDNWEIIWER